MQDWKLIQTINVEPNIMESVALCFIPQTEIPLLACGGVDTLIHLFIFVNDSFRKLLVLQGHQEWIRSLDFTECDNHELLLASGSQDTKIRIWKISLLSTLENSQSQILNSLQKDSSSTHTSMSSKGHIFRIGSTKYVILLESVLTSHDEWVYSVCWHPKIKKEGKFYFLYLSILNFYFFEHSGKLHQPPCLLSASMDRTMIIWKFSDQSGLWENKVRVGELGGNNLGFYGGLFGLNGEYILAHGFNGTFHLWKNQSTENKESK